MEPIDIQAAALRPVRARVEERIAEVTRLVVSPKTPLEQVPGYRGEIVALTWLLAQLSPQKEVVT